VNKDDQNPQFTVWLAAYGKRLIEVARMCSVADEPSESPSRNQLDSGPQVTPKQD
jgi:hypothetical protein